MQVSALQLSQLGIARRAFPVRSTPVQYTPYEDHFTATLVCHVTIDQFIDPAPFNYSFLAHLGIRRQFGKTGCCLKSNPDTHDSA
ncbi:hypothetical protein VN97_g2368 [Penicillium thymicola]|uniref:Uncharacterized protein n=1 Tax=Penicillium thymicola TaxID=293382 RepID=A0AAI9XB62_PENTH|nr:hypothetical protein VN97_g2368 [Penicillium thymicola]